MAGLEDYASPILRAAVFRQLFPGAQVSYSVIPIGNAFPLGHIEYEGKATEAVRCEIILADGTYVIAHKEMDKKEQLKSGTKDVAQTPEQLAKDETKALGRALRDLGVPQRLSELKILMQWVTSMNGRPATLAVTQHDVGGAETALAEAFPGSEVIDDSADAGSEDPTPEQLLAQRFAKLNGADKAHVAKFARDHFDVGNVMRAGEYAETLLAYVEKGDWLVDADGPQVAPAEQPTRRADGLRTDEEPF